MIKILNHTFASDEERRDYFRAQLREKMPELRKLEGFPIGTDDDIVALSDPPFYTACPNPWLNDFIAEWEAEKENTLNRKPDFVVDEPYAADVSEGKNNPIYNAHSYHTKVPHPAIMRYLLHYTQPGDIVLDGFAGTGMTGVAAQLCGNPDTETKYKIEAEWKQQFGANAKPTWGARKAILGDLSPVASFIAYNYNTPVDIEAFDTEAKRILQEVEKECAWMYETKHSNGATGRINYTIWSDVFTCPHCSGEIVFWETGINKEEGKVLDDFHCPTCNALTTKRNLDKKWITKYDDALGETIRQTKIVPVLINYKLGTKSFEKAPTDDDLLLIEKIQNTKINDWYPTNRMPEGDEARRNDKDGITNVHQFFTNRNLSAISSIWAKSLKISSLRWTISGIIQRANKQHQIAISRVGGEKANAGGKTAGHRRGTLYIPSIQVEFSVFELIRERLKVVLKALTKNSNDFSIGVQSANETLIKDNSIDYIFTDPPFGANIMYSELNYLWETWLKVTTNNKEEAIENRTQRKGVFEYNNLMTLSFKEYYRIIKPGKWMTVEFSNTSAYVWNTIQNGLQKAGFIVANVAALDKKQMTHSARTSNTAVKQDLVISCYKPSADFIANFTVHSGSDLGAWDFVREHLSHLPVHLRKGESTTAVVERSARILYDRLISFYIMRSLAVPIDARDFQAGLKQRFAERDDMYFLAEQLAEYDTLKATTSSMIGIATTLFVDSEKSGVAWLQAALTSKAQTYQDLQPKWMQSIQSVRKGDILPELRDILEDNFLKNEKQEWYIPDPNKAKDMEALRLKDLLKAFNSYLPDSSKKTKRLKEVRSEALRAGFKHAYDHKQYATIVSVGEAIPENILLEDEFLLMLFELAKEFVN